MLKRLKKIFIEWIEKELFTVVVEFKPHKNFYSLPTKMTERAGGYDVYCTEDITLQPGETTKIHFGFGSSFSGKYALALRTRSSIADQKLMHVTSTLDGDYHHGFHIILENRDIHDKVLSRGDRVAQIVCERICDIKWKKVDTFSRSSPTIRSKGFGDTGK